MTEGMEEVSAGPAPPFGSVSPTGSTVDTRQVPEEKPEETEAAGESGEEAIEGTAEGGGAGNDGEHVGAFGIVTLPEACCVCIEMEQINNCLHSEKICILPILACLLSLALCTAGLKWVFVDKIFEYEPPSHLDPKPIGQDPIIIPVEPTLGITVSFPHATPSNNSLTTTFTLTPEHPEVSVEDKSTQQPHVSQSSRVIEPAVTLKYNAEHYTTPKQTPQRKSTQKSHSHHQTISTISTSTTAKTSSHVTRCSDSQRNYCVNGGECFTLEIIPGSTKFLCRCPVEFTGDRCQNYVMASFYKAEELYQKRILTITGICIALLVVGIMCVVAYCKTKKQRKKLRDRLRQRLRNKRKNTSTGIDSNVANSTTGRPNSNLPLQDLQLIGQHNGKTMKHTAEKETETNLSTSKYTLSVHNPTTLTNISSQRFVPVMATSESQNSLATPGSPPSEISAPISSLAISVPSVTLSPSGEEERPLLHQLHKSSSRDVQKRTSSHYNHGHVADSLPSSPLFAMENTDYQTIQDTRAASYMFSIAPVKLINTNNNVSDCSNNSVTDHVVDYLRLNGDSILVSDTEEPRGEHIPFLSADRNTVLLLRAVDSGRTNPASPNDDLPVKSSSLINQQDLIAA
ncbi:pro-neuregulin-1, membrane-bound isoform isoform X3 [Maylandia zebra]|uniref:EGF-like domain-containing protein n=1 Tax=Astatotilapia calliptera TaxID=8154 RepID=A0AAX7UMG6_ASTCA|nr:pro-neuregulin-1, membrane-bound isoform isoform X3 [Maylandia zebra]XP_026028661.1 pro-neuregulin-1, membrane-bound isoform-like isoform X3 [Astatotilapia calliptera]